MRAIDTNVLVRLLVRDDAQQARLAEDYIKPGAWISHIVLVETLWVLASTFAHSRAAIAEALDLLLRHETLIVQEPELVAGALACYRSVRKVSFSDCLILESARKAGHAPVGTFDRDFAKLDGVERVGLKPA